MKHWFLDKFFVVLVALQMLSASAQGGDYDSADPVEVIETQQADESRAVIIEPSHVPPQAWVESTSNAPATVASASSPPNSSQSFWKRHQKKICAGLLASTAVACVGALAYGIYKAVGDDDDEHKESEPSPAPAAQSLLRCSFEFVGLQVQRRASELFSNAHLMKAMEIVSEPINNLTSVVSMVGSLLLRNNQTGANQTFFNWPVEINMTTGNWSIDSPKTVLVAPGTYEATFLSDPLALQQYAGSTSVVAGEGQNVTVSLIIRPIIGTFNISNFIFTNVSRFLIRYWAGDLARANITDPMIGLLLDENPETFFALNPNSGASDFYALIPGGMHALYLKLYDGVTLRAHSDPAFSNRFIVPGQDIVVDLIPFHVVLSFNFIENAGRGVFRFTIPQEIVNLMGPNSNLQILFALSGARAGLIENPIYVNITTTGREYSELLNIDGLHHENVTWALTFVNLSDDPVQEIGICGDTLTIDTSNKALTCNLQLFNNALLEGRLLAVVGVNVFRQIGNARLVPVTGALITMDNSSTVIGRTGDHSLGSRGFVKLYLPSGEHVLKATKGSLTGNASVDLDPLEVENVDIMVEQNE